MKEFWKDYGGLCKESINFGKKHWKGVVLLNVALVGAELAWYKYGNKVTNINFGKKSKKGEEAQ